MLRTNLLLLSLAATGALAAARPPAPKPSPRTRRPAAAPAVKRKPSPKPRAVAKPATPPRQTEAAPVPAPMPAPKPTRYTLSGPIDINAFARQGRVSLLHTKLSSGSAERVFDPNRTTEAVATATRTQPAFWQVVLDRPRPLDAVDVTFGDAGPYEWTLLGGDTGADLAGRRGSCREIVPWRAADVDSQASFAGNPPFKAYRLECRPTDALAEVHLAAWELWTPQQLERVEIQAPDDRVAVGSRLPLRALGRFDAGAVQNLTPDVTWEVNPPEVARVDGLVQLEGRQAGAATVLAKFRDQRPDAMPSAPWECDVTSDGRPDWTVTHLELGPRVEYDAPPRTPGQRVVWFGHVKNYGAAEAPAVRAEWRVDGKPFQRAGVPKLERYRQTDVMLSMPWSAKRQRVELVIDPENQITEESEDNNALTVYNDALTVGFWVEQSTVDYFHRNQRRLGTGGARVAAAAPGDRTFGVANSWEDWAQRQIAVWNRFQVAAQGLFLPPDAEGVRWRLDRLIIVGDGMLPMSGGNAETEPDRRERTVHLACGFPAYDPARNALYRRTDDQSPQNPFYIQQSLVRALARAHYPKSPVRPPAPLD